MNFDIATTRLTHLLRNIEPEVWRQNPTEPAPGIRVTDDPRSQANVELAVIAPALAREVLFMLSLIHI